MRKLIVEIIGDAKSLEAEFAKAGASSDQMGSKFSRIGKVAGVAGLAIVGGLAVGIDKSVKAAEEAQASQARLEAAFRAVGLSATASAGQIDAAEASARKLGFTDDEVRTALGSLTIATHDVGESIKDLAVAQDLARFKSIPLADATKMITMAMTGSQRAAKQLGIVVQPLTTHYDALKATMGKTSPRRRSSSWRTRSCSTRWPPATPSSPR
jgi:hypothetical protein